MDLVKELGKKINDIASKSKGNSGIAYMKSQLAEKEKELAEIYQSIGKTYFELQSEAPLAELAELVTQAKEKMAQMEEFRAVIQKLEAGTLCPACGMKVEEGTLFCVYCGAKLESAKKEVPAEKHCINCGAVLPAEAAFCSNCGSKQK